MTLHSRVLHRHKARNRDTAWEETKITVARSAKTGKFVTKSYAVKHKNTTEIEHYKVNRNKK
jgi:predicted NAD-dependent protein-ADP-ribosyltransferase YbiA (DUF1768 family)